MNQLKAGATLNYIVLVLNTLVNLLYTPYMLRMMGQSEYGLYSLVASIIGYLTILDLGFGNAIVRYTAKYRAEGKAEEQYKMFGMFFVLYMIIGAVAFCIGLGIYFNTDNIFGDTMTAVELYHARIMMLILVFNLAFTFPMSIFGSIMSAYERFVFPKIISIIRIILNTSIMILLLSQGYKAIAMASLTTLFNVLTLIINFVYCKKKLHIKIKFGRFQWGFLKEVSIYSLWIFLNAIMDRIYWSTGQFVLGAVVGTAAVSVFAVAIHLENMYIQFSTAISSVFLPKVTSLVTNNAKDKELSDLFIRTGRIQNIIMCLILFGFIVFGQQFINLWAGMEYSDAYIMTLAFFISLYTPLIQNMGIIILQARNQMKFRSLLYICLAALALVAEVVFSKHWGGIGCAFAVAMALIIGQGFVMNIYYLNVQHIDIIKFWKEILKMDAIPLLLTFISLYLTRKVFVIDSWIDLCIGVFIFIIFYFALIIPFGMNSYERNILLKPIISKLKK